MKKTKNIKWGMFICFFCCMTLLGFVLGRIVGRSIKSGKGIVNIGKIFDNIDMGTAGVVFTIAFILIEAALLISAAVAYSGAKKRADKWDGDDENEIELIEKELNIVLLLINVVDISSLGFLGCCCYLLVGTIPVLLIPAGVVMIISYLLTIVLTHKAVELEKKLNPEKQGSVFDLDFQKKWIGSFDEAEIMQAYKACYAAFMTTNKAFSIFTIVLFFAQFIFKTGIMPIISVTALWLVLNVSYVLACMKESK